MSSEGSRVENWNGNKVASRGLRTLVSTRRESGESATEQQSSGHEISGCICTPNPQRGSPNATGRKNVKLDEAQCFDDNNRAATKLPV